MRNRQDEQPSPDSTGLSRRRFFKRAAWGAGPLAVGLGVYAWQIEPHWIEVTTVELPVRGLGVEFDGYRVVHVSDLHTGNQVSTSYLRTCMDRINALDPDLIVITGDLITGGLDDQIATAAGLVARLEARDGTLVSLGNHDYHSWAPGRERLDVADRLVAAVNDVGARALRNECRVIRRGESAVNVVGLDELLVDRCDPEPAFASIDQGKPVIALSHNPESMGILRHWPVDVVLSGHTHGGQVCLPIIGPLHLPIDDRRYASGLVEEGDRRLYVTRGLGHLLQVRLGCRPEIAVHHLRRA